MHSIRVAYAYAYSKYLPHPGHTFFSYTTTQYASQFQFSTKLNKMLIYFCGLNSLRLNKPNINIQNQKKAMKTKKIPKSHRSMKLLQSLPKHNLKLSCTQQSYTGFKNSWFWVINKITQFHLKLLLFELEKIASYC